MSESLSNELQRLERSGRVTARGHRPVHAEFGFTSITSSQQPVASTAAADEAPVANRLDDAYSRLKRRIDPTSV
jgi:hypothetical protein